MGDPKKQRRKFLKPSHPWQKSRLDEESVVVSEYSLKNKNELWKMQSKLKGYKSQAKDLIAAASGPETAAFLNNLRKLKLIPDTGQLDDVLGLKLKDILERRLQTLVFRRRLAGSMRQARQFIVHKHIAITGRLYAVPSYLVSAAEEDKIGYSPNSQLNNPDHAARVVESDKK